VLLKTLDVPVSSADAGRTFKLKLSSCAQAGCRWCTDGSVRALHSAAWNGGISGRFRGYDLVDCELLLEELDALIYLM
jgi:hypothetical protein